MLHQKLKFVKNGKLVVVRREWDFIVSHLSSFSYIDASEEFGTQFQVLSIYDKSTKKIGAFMASYKDGQRVVQSGVITSMDVVLDLPENKFGKGLGCSPTTAKVDERDTAIRPIQETFP